MLIFLFSALIVLTDQFFKHWIVLTHAVGEETVLIPGVFSLFRLHNPGAAFGFLAGQPWWLLAAIQLLAAIVLVMIILRYTEGFWGSLGLASVLGGTVGNLIDRVNIFAEQPNTVTDMFRFTFIDFAIFNIADVFITMGFLIFLIHFIALTFKPKNNEEALIDGDDADYINDDESDEIVENVAVATPNPAPLPAVDPVAAFEAAPLPVVDVVAAPISVSDTAVTPQDVVLTAAPTGNMTEPVDPMSIFETDPQAEPLSEPAVQEGFGATTEPLPIIDALISQPESTIEIAPLLDHVYGGQYIAAQKAEATAPQAPVAPQTPETPQAPAAPEVDPFLAQTIKKTLTSEPLAEPLAQTTQAAPPTKPSEDLSVASVVSDVLDETASLTPIVEESSDATLDALSVLESEILGETEEYDVDKLLGEYGFESDADDDQNDN